MLDLWKDVRHAARSLARSPGFTATAVLTLTLGIGANALIFSLVDHAVLRPLPYPDADRLVAVWEAMSKGEMDAIQRESRTLDASGGYIVTEGFNLEVDGAGTRVGGARFGPGLMELLGSRPALGRTFRDSEGEPGGDPVALISHGLWLDLFGGRSDVLGTTLRVDGTPRAVVGVLPAGFDFPSPGQDVVVPLVSDPSDPGTQWGFGGHQLIGRLAPGSTPADVRAELRELFRERIRPANPLWTPEEGARDASQVTPLRERMVGEVRPMMFVLLGAVGLVLLVACANVANLLLARGLSRGRELAVRTALGASRARIVRERLVESLLLAGLGCGVALVSAQLALGGLVARLPEGIPRAGSVSLDARVVGVSVALALLAGAAAGLVPALRSARSDAGSLLREGGRGGTGSAARRKASAVMVVAQTAMAVVLVVGAGLLLRSLGALNAVDPGFPTGGLTVARLTLTGTGYEAPDARMAFFDAVRDRVAALPGVRGAGVGSHAPFGDPPQRIATFIDGVTDNPNALPMASRYRVAPGYTEALGLRVLEGRALDRTDDGGGRLVAVVDSTMAERFWPGESALGRRVRYPWRDAPWITVVGVISGMAEGDLAAPREPVFFVPFAQAAGPDATVLVRWSGDDPRHAAAVRAAVREVDARVPVARVASMDDALSGSLSRSRFLALILAAFAATTLLLGAVGVYGVVAYSVRERTREIGVKVALGAEPGRIRGAVLADGLRLALPGTVIGLVLAFPATRLLEGMLFGVSTLDPLTWAAVPLVLCASALLAVYVPARRATRVSPLEALRSGG